MKRSTAHVRAMLFCLAVSAGCLMSGCTGAAQKSDPSIAGKGLPAWKLDDNAKVLNGRDGLPRQGECFDPAWKPGVGESRDIATEAVYKNDAPSIVIVKLPNGLGSAFIVDNGGWLVTNNHVAADAGPDPDTGVQTVDLLFGKLDDDGDMKLVDQPVRAQVYKLNPIKDLALLKVVSPLPHGVTLKALPFAAANPKPGSDCVAIGNPASESLWSVREGQVTGTGLYPGELTDTFLSLFTLKGDDAEAFREQLKHTPETKYIYSSTGINSGDSGSPLLNTTGEVIGVSVAMPTFNEEHRQGTISYHIALSELKDFLADRPADPIIVTDPWPNAMMGELKKPSDQAPPDALMFAPAKGDDWTAILFDFLHKSDPNVTEDQLADPANRGMWKYQFAVQRGAVCRAFYDTHGTGTIDLILCGPDLQGQANVALRLVKGHWRTEPPADRAVLSPDQFDNADLRAALTAEMNSSQNEPATTRAGAGS